MLLIQVQPILNSILLYADEASAEYCACSFFIILITSLGLLLAKSVLSFLTKAAHAACISPSLRSSWCLCLREGCSCVVRYGEYLDKHLCYCVAKMKYLIDKARTG